MGDNKDKKSVHRRTIIKLTAGTGAFAALPETWTKPIVQSVILPAHAQTSPLRTATTTTAAPGTTRTTTTTTTTKKPEPTTTKCPDYAKGGKCD